MVDNINIFKFENAFYNEYFSVFLTLLIGLALASLISGASYFLSRQASDPEKLSPYECGFEPFEDARNTFDIRFYLVAILFILLFLETAVAIIQAYVFTILTCIYLNEALHLH